MTSQQTTMKIEQADFLVCQHILDEFKRPKHRKYVRSFVEPVNIVAVPTYLNVVRQPMDLSTIAFKLGKDTYDNALAFRADFELMLDNSDTFNAGHPPSPVFEQGIQLREEFNLVWADQINWLKRVHPHILNKPHSEEDKENMDEPPTKKRRQSSRLVATSSTMQSPYTAASVVRKSASNPVTPVPGASTKPSQERTSLPGTSRADSVSFPAKQGAATQAPTIRRAASIASELTEIDLLAPQAEEPKVAATQTNSRATGDQTHNNITTKTAKTPWEDFQGSLRAMVTTEATALLKDPNIKRPNDSSNSFANTLWLAMAADDNNASAVEVGKASFSAWVELAVEELSKVVIRDVGDMIKSETKEALMVITDRHHIFLRNKLEGCYEAVRARLED